MQIQLNRYNNVKDKRGKIVALGEVVEAIKSGVVASHILKLKAAVGKDDIKSIKATFPAVTFSGTFKNGRLDADILNHSGLICLDFDDVEDIDALWAELIEFPYTVLIFISPSGTGIKAVIHIAAKKELHRSYFATLKKLFPTADPSGSNEARLCFLSFDKNLYYNPKAPQMPEPLVEMTPPPVIAPQQTKAKVEYQSTSGSREEDMALDIIQYLRHNGMSLTYDYNDWLKVGYTLLNTFDYSTAEELFCLFSSLDVDKFDDAGCRKTLEGLRKNNKQPRGFGYIISAATLAGWNNQSEFNKKSPQKTLPPPQQPKKNNSPVNSTPPEFATLPFLKIRKTKTTEYVKVNNFELLKYIESMGFVKIKFDDGKFRFFKLDDAKIKEVEIADMTSELRQNINRLPDTIMVNEGEMEVNKDELHSLVFDVLAEVFTEKKLNYTTPLSKGFLKDSKDNSFFTFQNRIISVTKDEIVDFGYDQCSTLVWSDHIISHTIKIDEKPDDEKCSCEFADFLWHLCGQNTQRFMQFRTTLGYLLRTYRDPSIAVAVILTEEKVVDGVADGGTGKGIFSKALEYLRSVYVVDGKRNKIDSQFAFQRYDLSNSIVSYQDGEFGYGFNKFFNVITDGMTVERKNNKELFLPFKATREGQFEAPVWLITTNMPIRAEGNAVRRRLHICEVSSFWKDKLPIDHFGHNLFYDWDTAEWNKFYNFMFRCCQDFLKYRLIKAEGVNAELNNLISLTHKKFVDWFHNFLLEQRMWEVNSGDCHRSRPWENRPEFYRQIADYCGWGVIDNGNRIEITQASVKGSNNQVLRWLEVGCRALNIGLNDRAKGSMGVKSVSTFEFTLDLDTIAKVKEWLLKHCLDAEAVIGGVGIPVQEEIFDFDDVPF